MPSRRTLAQVLAEPIVVARLRRQLATLPRPAHVGLIMDGNRRWARSVGVLDARFGHRAGAEHLGRFLTWCENAGVEAVSVYVMSADNIAKRDDAEVSHLMELLETVIAPPLTRPGNRWELRVAGDLSLLPDGPRAALLDARERTAGRPYRLTLAIGYDPHEEIVTAAREVVLAGVAAGASAAEVAQAVDVAVLDRRIAAPGLDIDLVIRTSGERRGSGFFPWRTARAEYVFCDVYWPAFREADLLQALRTYGRRKTGH